MHEMQALIGSDDAVAALAHVWPSATKRALAFGLSIVPLDDALTRQMTGVAFRFPDLEDPATAGDLVKHVEPLVRCLRQVNLISPFVLVVTQYFGGTGTQAALLLDRGDIRLGPFVGDGSINRVLDALGVRPEGGSVDRDAFAAIGLDRWRSTEDMAKRAG